MKKLSAILTFVLCLALTAAFAQDTIGKVPTGGGGITDWLIGNYVLFLSIVYGVYEVVVRLIPTVANWSIISRVMQMIHFLIPNNKVTGGTFNNR